MAHGHGGGGFVQDDEILGKAYDAALTRRLVSYLGPYKRGVVGALVLLLLMAVSGIMPPVIAKFIVDSAIAPAVTGQITEAEAFARLGFLGFAYVVVLAFSSGVRYWQSVLTTEIGQRAMYDLRLQLFRHLQFLPLGFFDRNPVGRLMTRITNDIDALTEMVSRGVVSIFGDLFTLAAVMVAMLLLDVRLALVTFLVIPVLVGITAYFRGMMRESFRAIRIRLARVNAYLNETLSGMSIIQLFTREKPTFAQFDALNLDLYKANQGAVRAMSTFQPSIMFTRAATTAILFTAGGMWIIAGELTIGTLLAFWQLLEQFFRPILDLAERYNILQAAMASSERVFRLLDEPRRIEDPPKPVHLAHVRGEVTFDHVWFAYNELRRGSEDPASPVRATSDHARVAGHEPEQDWVLRDVDFEISAGESVAIVGATGAGKTSITSLISRFYDVQKGRILLDGVDVRDMRQPDLRSHVGVVLQDPFIFAGTIASNIRLNESRITDDQVRAAARFVNADRFIEQLPQGYDTVVTERGSTLSVGQKQLLAFARAIAFNPEIMLVLDEATSSVDTETEHLIQDALAKLMRGRTSIIIAHRLSTIQNVDRILVLHKGRLVESGSHRDLLAQRGVYHRLYELQYRAHEAAAR
ncbi:MAG TPA: ABC transporter ATP-binding protein [Candidatus Limnocylindria bacterium]|nr:ABC transporter ATP-binding protein [Candidatus Limnocylindria bacterium]